MRLRPVTLRKSRGLSLANLRAFRSALRAERPDLLLTYNWGAIEWALADRFRPICPHLHVVDGFGPEEALRQLPRRVWLRRLALSGPTTVVVPSQALRRLAVATWKLDPNRVRHIPNGVDAAALAPGAREPWRLRQADELLFGTLGGLRPEKNLGRLLRIAAMLPKDLRWRLVIAGAGQERAALEARARARAVERVVDRLRRAPRITAGRAGRLRAHLGYRADADQRARGDGRGAAGARDRRRRPAPHAPCPSRSTCLFAREEENAFAERLAALLAAPDERRRLGAPTARKRRSSASRRW